MDEGMGCLGGVFALLLLTCAIVVAGLLITSHAVLYSESPAGEYGFTCKYFSGTRSIELTDPSQTGCSRFIKVGSR